MAYLPNSTGEDQWDDIITPGFALGTGQASPALISLPFVTGLRCYGFSGTNNTPDELFAFFELPHGYKEGSDLHVHVHWTPETADIADVKWQCSYSVAPVNGSFGVEELITGTESTAGLNSHILTALSPVIDGTNLKIGSIIACRLFRNAQDSADTYTGHAVLLSFGIHYQADTLGSRQIATK